MRIDALNKLFNASKRMEPSRRAERSGLFRCFRVIRVSQFFVTGALALALALPGRAAAQDTTITIRALSSTLEFVPARISVKTGTRIKLRFVNEGTLPHNFVLPRSDDDIDALALASYQAGEHGFVAPAWHDKLIAWTRLASPGETVEVEFVVPAPGSYTYVCVFPGHAASMLGILRSLR